MNSQGSSCKPQPGSGSKRNKAATDGKPVALTNEQKVKQVKERSEEVEVKEVRNKSKKKVVKGSEAGQTEYSPAAGHPVVEGAAAAEKAQNDCAFLEEELAPIIHSLEAVVIKREFGKAMELMRTLDISGGGFLEIKADKSTPLRRLAHVELLALRIGTEKAGKLETSTEEDKVLPTTLVLIEGKWLAKNRTEIESAFTADDLKVLYVTSEKRGLINEHRLRRKDVVVMTYEMLSLEQPDSDILKFRFDRLVGLHGHELKQKNYGAKQKLMSAMEVESRWIEVEDFCQNIAKLHRYIKFMRIGDFAKKSSWATQFNPGTSTPRVNVNTDMIKRVCSSVIELQL